MNEEFKLCGSSCQPTCDHPEEIPCDKACRQGCFCKEGFVRDAEGNCVEKSTCAITCGENEEYSSCGSACGDLTCENPSYTNMMCTDDCKRGCFCVEGYVRKNGKCILQSDCQMNCPANEIYTPCSANCEPDCKNPHRMNLVCPLICLEGCICDEGLVRSNNGKCIPAQQCHKGEKVVKWWW